MAEKLLLVLEVNGEATKTIGENLNEIENLAKSYMDGKAELRIRTAHSLAPVKSLLYSYVAKKWIEED